jgi:amino acid adenylation domain-containing protein
VPPIGRPIDNLRTFVADAWGGLAPRGSVGELWVGGAGLARGYLDRPALTAERFVPDPWSGAAGERLYRTGDRVRHRPDGNLEFLGRIDHQIKLRGFRIEPGEIEALLRGHPAVSEAAVAVLTPARLVAYVVGRDGLVPSATELRKHLRERLPAYMVPAAYVVLPALPLTPSGKLDRKALPDPGTEERGATLAPRTPTEELVARIFAEVLKVERVGRDDDFFELGGHSLLVTQVVSRVRAACGLELPVRAVFEAPTVERLAAWLESSPQPAAGPFRMPARAPSLRQEPLSFAQQRLWFLDQLEPGSPLYNIAVAVELRGRLDPGTLAAALGEVVRRHEALRTTFRIVAGEPVQVVAESAGFDLPRIDLASLPERACEEEADRLAADEARRPFDLGQDAPLRAALLRLDQERHVLLLTMHHIVSDGWSMGVLVREIGALYAAQVDLEPAEGRPSPLPELALQYADFAAWQRRHLSGEHLEAELAWWRGQLAGMPQVLELPADHPRPGGRGARGEVHRFGIGPELLAGLTVLSRKHGTTLFMTLLAGFAALLERWTGQDDLGIGTPIAGRTLVETEPLIGLFVNTLVLRSDLAGDPGFVDLLGRVRETTLAAYAHQEVPFERLVEELAPERAIDRPPLVQVLFALQNAPSDPLELPGLVLTASSVPTGTARLELSCLLAETERGLDGTVEYRRDLFERETIARLVEHLVRLLAGAVEDPRRRVSELPLLSDRERAELLVEWSGGATDYPREATIHGLFAEQAALRPDATAVVGTRESLTYRELRHRAGELARHLRSLGIGPEMRVGVCLERSPERVVATLGVLEAGGVYVPLDPAYPDERLGFLLADAGVQAVLVHEPTRERMTVLAGERGYPLVEVEHSQDFKDGKATDSSLGGSALAYVMYTSGSTGEPKGVAVPHRAVVRLVRGTGYARFGADEVFLQLAPYSFDASTLELWGALLNGGRLVLPPPGVLPPDELGELLSYHRVTTLWLTAGLFHQMVEENLAGLAGVRQLLAGGDVLSVPHVRRVLEELPGTRLINGYGPTENTTFTCCHPLAGPEELETSVPLGRPIANTRVVVLDRHLAPVPVGVAGELCTGGDGLARGYLGRPDRTAERFVPDPFGREAGGRLYRTGDLARWRPAGTLEFLGRIDSQVKVRGFRVEPGEIETALLEHPGVREAAVLAQRDGSGSQRLVAYVVLHPADPAEPSELSDPKPALAASLRGRLPEFMLPAAWVFLPSLPLTANGKVDRQALAKLRPERSAARADGAAPAPRTPAEELVARIFAEVLELERVEPDEDFFELGGHSLLATQVSSRVRAASGLELPVRMVFEEPTVAGLAAWLERSAPGTAGERIARVPREEPLVLSFAQQRLWFLDQLEPGNTVYNIPAAVELAGPLDAGAMTAAFGEVVRRHEVLRTTFREVAGDPVQVVGEPAGFSLPRIDLAGLPTATAEREVGRLAAAEARRPFDLEAGPLLRSVLLRSAADRHLLVVTMHHIVSDGWSMGVLVRELGALYATFREGRPSPLPPLAVQYADFAAWQRQHLSGDLVEAELAWWTEKLAGIPPALEMPADHPRPAVSSLRGAVHGLAIAAEDVAGLIRLSRQHDATPFMTLLAGFAALLSRASGQEDVVVGTPIAGRTRIETEPLIGFFVNTLALSTDLSGAPGFLDLLARVRETTLAAYAHQELPFERLVEELAPERDRSRTPIFQAMLAFQNNASEALALPGVAAEIHALTTGTAKFDLNLVLSETAQGGLTGLIEFSLDLFDGTTIARLAGHLARLLAAAAADPFLPVRELPLLSDGERHQLLAEWNDTRAPFPETTLLHQFFEASVERAPEALAAVCAGGGLTYADLEARGNRLAHLLRGAGVERGTPVGVWIERSLDMLVAVLGVLKAGGHYVALDETWPADRVESILASTGAPAIVAGPGLLGAVEEMRWRLPRLSDVVCLAFADPEPPAEEIDPESVRALGDFVAERATDRVTAGGFVSAFTGEPMSAAEVDEYRDRVLTLAGPWLRPDARVLEIGNGSGLLLWEMASRAAHVTGVDPSPLTQERNREHAAREGIANVELRTGFAHEVDGLLGAEERFDLILLASTVQFFPGPRYLERVVGQALGRLAPGGALLIADVLDARRREELRQVTDEHRRERGLEPAAPRRELFLDEDLFRDLGGAVHHRTSGFPNELGYRYDVLLTGEMPSARRKRLWTGWHVERCPADRLPQVAAPEDVAYVIHTSGSTGEPKGIVVQHRPAANLVDWINRMFEIGPADRGLFVTSLCFDLSVWDIFGMLAAGGTVHVATRDELADPDHLVRLLRTGGITLWDSAPAALLQLAPLFPAEPDTGSLLRRVMLSGDWIPVTLPDRVRQSFPGAAVMALGGATEATVWSNWFPVGVVGADWPSIPYGRPMANARYLVLDEGFAPCPIGVPGDLYIGGDCLCAGYARRPELTAQAFLPDPFSGVPGARLYRTGDRARAFPDGNLEFLGRLDQQVKVRGYRIELGEIEVALARHHGVREAVAMAREDEPGDKRLVAYVVPADGADLEAEELREALRRSLPEYMIPSAFVLLPELPVTANGKLDRRALPAPQYSASAGYVAAQTPTEEALAAIWSSLLGVSQVGREDGFFDLGGHSLLATQMLSRVREAFGTELSLRTLFDKPRLAELAEAVDAAQAAGGQPTVPMLQPTARPRRTGGQGLPLSFAQQRLWFLEQLEPGNPAYNIPVALRLDGRLDRRALAAALAEVVRRHEVLRTAFPVVAGEPVQVVAESAGFALPLIDLLALPSAGEREEEAGRLAAEEARRPFDLGDRNGGPLLRAALLRLGSDRHTALVTMHHMASDAWSMGVLVREIGTLYEAFAGGRPSPLPALAVQYAELAAWQRQHLSGEHLAAELGWWRERLAGMPQVLDLPADLPRPAVRSVRGASHGFTINREGLAGLAELSRQQRATLFMTLLAGFAALLHRWTGADDLAVGTPIAGRTQSEAEALIGLFVNTLVLRTDLSGDPRLADLLDRVRETTLAAYAHQEVPFERLVEELAVERDLSRPPLVQVLLILQNAPAGPLELPGLALTASSVETGTAKLDLSCTFVETEQGLAGTLEYSRDLFEHATIERMAEHLTRLLAGAAADPRRRLSELPLLSPQERRQLLVVWNEAATVPFTPAESGTLHGLFTAQAARTPEATALVAGLTGERWSYRELDERSGRLAHRLTDLGVGPEVRVAVRLPRTPELVAALLAVLKAGGAYVPLDPEYPRERLDFLLEDSGAAVLISEEGIEPLREPARGTASSAVSAASVAAQPGNLAYLIYTSGSTGRPKGVAIEHRRAVAFALWARTVFTPEDFSGVLAATSVSFDLSVFELFVTLAWGGTVILAANALELPQLPVAGEVTLLNTVPSAMAELVRLRAVPESVRTVNLAGEPLKRSLVEAIYASTSASRVLDLYGPSEATTYSTWAPAVRGDRREPAIGRPIAGTRALLLGAHGELVPVGAVGELLLGGAGLARGYLGRPDLTAARFVPNPFADQDLGGSDQSRLYRTGDLARYLPDGRLDYLGRIDHQVKVRGFRIELGEIEAALLAHGEIQAAAVAVREDAPGDQRLVAYVVPAATPAPAGLRNRLRDALRQSLPAPLVPSSFVVLRALPLTPNGKLDRRALPAPAQGPGGVYAAPRTSMERILAAIWSSVLGVPRVGREDDFFVLGGHSLLATQMLSRVREACGVELPLRSVFELPRLVDFAGALEAAAAAGGEAAAPRLRPGGRMEGIDLPLSFAQQRLWFLEQLEPGSPAYNIPVAIHLTGRLDPAALAAALGEVVRRHEALRTTFRAVAGEPVQVIAESAGVALPLIDLQGLADEVREGEAARRAAEEARRPFNLGDPRGLLIRAALLRLDAERHTVLVTMHHIVSDGWSMGVLVRELGALYAAQVNREQAAGRPSPLPELAVQYADIAAWQRRHLSGEHLEAELAWWRERLAGMPQVLDLADHPRPAQRSARGATQGFTIGPEGLAGLADLSRQHGATLFMTLLAGFAALLHRWTGADDLAVGTPIAGRTQGETEALIGLFVNTLVLRTDLSGDPELAELLDRVRETTLSAYAHQEVPFERLVEELAPERDLSRPPLVQVLLVLQNAPAKPLELPGLALTVSTLETGTAKLDLACACAETEQGLTVTFEYSRDLFERATIERLAGHFARLLAEAVADPRRRLSELPRLSPEERQQLLERIDRQADRIQASRIEPWQIEAAPYQEPRTPAEQILAEIWSAMLRVPQVGREDSFFDLGGHSLLATQMISRVQEACGVELSLRAAFEKPKLADLARVVEAAQGTVGGTLPPPPMPPRPAPRTGRTEAPDLPLSFAQQRLWLLQQLEPGSATYNMPVAVEMSGRLRRAALAAALAEVVRRHESLRTTFTVAESDGAPLQRIAPVARVALPLADLAALPASSAAAEAERLAQEQADLGFDLEQGPLLRTLLVRLEAERHQFLVTLHHIVSDGWSIGVLIQELGVLYAAFLEGRTAPLPELPIQYADFAVWQREQLADKQAAELEYWESRLGGEVATVELPTDRPRPAIQTFRGGRRQLTLSPDLSARLKSFGRGKGATLFMTLLAATQALLSRHSGELDVPVGAPLAGRQHGATEGLIGCFLNTLVLRTDLAGGPSFRELLARVRTVTLEAYAHQDVPFEAVLARLRLDRDLSRSPLFQVLFNLLNLPARDLALPGLDLRVLTPAEVPSKLDMTFYVAEADARILFNLVYNADLFDEARMADVLAQLEGLLAQAVERPDTPVEHLSLVTPAARALLPDPRVELPVPAFPPVARLVLDRARSWPGQPALAWNGGAWTYAQLAARAREVARAAVAAGVGPRTVVAVAGSRSPELIAGLLGVFLSGGVLLILDPRIPEARRRVMVEEAQPGCLVYIGEPRPEDDWLWKERPLPVLTVQPEVPDLAPDAPEDVFPVPGPDDPAYVFFTSGTTGRPKAVLGRQKGLSHFLTWQRTTFGIGPGDRAAQLTGLSFDVVLRDVFLPLTSGATLVLPDEDDVSPERILLWLREREISVVHTVPSLASAWLGAAPAGFQAEALRWTFFAGEPLLAQVVARWREAFPETNVVNLYGPTETTLAKCFYQVPDPPVQDVQPVGTPLPQTQALVLAGEKLCGLGEVGEIVIRTPFRSLGYLNNPEENRRFRPNPFRNDADDLLYVSGDRGRYRLDGTVEILGRLDEQVKIRGVRIEPAEIRAALGRHPAVWESAILVREQRPGDQRLVAYLVLRPGVALDPEALRRHLRHELPDAMVPSTFVVVEALPLTPNGKLDRRALSQMGTEIGAGSGDEERALRTPVEEIVGGVVAEVLGVPRVGPDDSFFQLGGHSLSGAQLVSRLRQALQVDLPLRTLFEAPTVAGLAAEIERRRRAGVPERPAISSFRGDHGAPPPLSFAQERFWVERQLESRTVASTLPTLVALEGPLDVVCLRSAVQALVDRHEVLRTTFRNDPEGRPVQVIHAALPVRLPIVDLTPIPRPVQRAEIERWSIADGRSPFDYERGPLFRMTLFRCAEREHAILFTIHHVAFDGWSRSVLLGELAVLYNAFREGRPSPLRPLPAQYQDFARWQRQVLQGEALEREIGFWREHLRGATPVRLGRELSRHPTYAAGLEPFSVPEVLERKLEAFAAEYCVTLFMILLAAFKALLHLESGRDDIVVTSLFANRNQLETEGLIGNFFAGLPLRTRLDGARTFRDLLERVRDVTLAAHEHPDILYEQAMEGLSFLAPGERGGIASFRIMFQLAKLPRSRQVLADLKLSSLPFDTGKIRQDLTLFFSQADRLGGRFKYNRDVLDAAAVVRLRDRLLRILETIVVDPDRPLTELLVEGSAVLEGAL